MAESRLERAQRLMLEAHTIVVEEAEANRIHPACVKDMQTFCTSVGAARRDLDNLVFGMSLPSRKDYGK